MLAAREQEKQGVHQTTQSADGNYHQTQPPFSMNQPLSNPTAPLHQRPSLPGTSSASMTSTKASKRETFSGGTSYKSAFTSPPGSFTGVSTLGRTKSGSVGAGGF